LHFEKLNIRAKILLLMKLDGFYTVLRKYKLLFLKRGLFDFHREIKETYVRSEGVTMKKKINRALSVISLVCCILIGIMYTGAALADGFAVIINKTNNTDNVSFSDLVKYFSAQKRFWPNQKKVTILLPGAGSEEKELLLKKVYNLSEEDLKKEWVGKVYKGEITSPPKTVSSSAAVIKAVMEDEGGMGVVKTGNVSDNVKVLKIDGKSPAEPGFPLVK